IFASDADHTKTFTDANAQWVDFQFYPTGGDTTKPLKLNYDVNDPSVTNVTATFEFIAGDDWTWIRNANANGNGKNFSIDVPVQFIAGNFSLNPSALTVTLTVTRENPKHSLAVLTVAQPTTGKPVLLKMIICRVSVPVSAGGDGNLTNRDKIHIGDDIAWSTLGGSQSHSFVIQHPAAAQGVNVQMVIVAHGGLQRISS